MKIILKKATTITVTVLMLAGMALALIPRVHASTDNNREASSQNIEPAADSPVVTIPDIFLEESIRNQLGLEEGVEITQADMETLTYFSVQVAYGDTDGVKSLDGLQYAIHLESLDFIGGPGEVSENGWEMIYPDAYPLDYSVLSSFPELLSINFNSLGNGLVSLPDFSNNLVLEYIYLSNVTGLKTLDGIELAKSLRYLGIYNGQITDYSALDKGTLYQTLEMLNIMGAPYQVVTVDKFFDFTRFDLLNGDATNSLSFDGIQFADIDAILEMVARPENQRSLYIRNNSIQDIGWNTQTPYTVDALAILGLQNYVASEDDIISSYANRGDSEPIDVYGNGLFWQFELLDAGRYDWYSDLYPINYAANAELHFDNEQQFNYSSYATVFMTVKDATAPSLLVSDQTLLVDDNFDALAGAYASDDIDGDITNQIQVLENNVDMSRAGHYTVRYRVENNWGLSTTATAIITVNERASVDTDDNTTLIDDSTRTDLPVTGEYGFELLLGGVASIVLASLILYKKRK